jgi:hypothetical protein|tara:strand:+ start:3512 stop:3766 length:255 start_codon:yes stop_codon:yes gene_type:complete
MITSDYTYEDNMEVMDHIINELMIVRTIQEIKGFDRATMITFLTMFPTVSEKGDIIEEMFNKYCDDYTVKEWYESLFKVEITKR